MQKQTTTTKQERKVVFCKLLRIFIFSPNFVGGEKTSFGRRIKISQKLRPTFVTNPMEEPGFCDFSPPTEMGQKNLADYTQVRDDLSST